MTTLADQLQIEHNALIPTWFGVGGRADRLARPGSPEQLRRCLELDPALRVLGEGANLLVDDDGVGELVVAMTEPGMRAVTFVPDSSRVIAMAGADLPRLCVEAVRRGRAGLEGLGGIPATIGGAAVMNAGGAFGQFADAVKSVRAFTRDGREVVIPREKIDYRYRHSGLNDLVIVSVELELPEGDPEALRTRLKDVMAYKKRSQPMADRSAGCFFKNPTLTADIEGIGAAGQRVSAGMLIDRAGCKRMGIGGASVSERHANFVVTGEGAGARDVIELMAEVRRRVRDAFNVELDPEVVVWRRSA